MPSRYVEMSYVSQPPVYDTRRQPNGEPPGYLDTSQREFPHNTDAGYILDEHGYPLDDRGGGGYAPETRGYEGGRDFGMMDQRGFPQEYPEYGGPMDRYPGGDMSYDSQAMMMIPGHSSEELIHRDDRYNRPMTDPMAVHIRDPADRPYGAADPMPIHIRDADMRDYAGSGQRRHVSVFIVF